MSNNPKVDGYIVISSAAASPVVYPAQNDESSEPAPTPPPGGYGVHGANNAYRNFSK